MARRPELTRMVEAIDRNLRAIRERIRRPLEAAVARGNLTGPQQSVMHALVRSDGMSLKQLSAHLGLAHSTVSGIVDRLQERGLVERRDSETDGRVTVIGVTRQVRDFVRDTLPGLLLHPLEQALARATAAQRGVVMEGLKTLRELLENP
jgi:DNA-binding MarR family transcriptional regulator